MPAEIQIKGLCFSSSLDALRGIRGADAQRALEARASPDLRDTLTGLVRGDWYPVARYRELHALAQEVTGEGRELARRIGYLGTLADFNSVYGALAFALTPRTVIAMAPRVFGAYYRPADMYVVEARGGYAHTRWANCHGFDANVWQDVLGGCVAIVEVSGGAAVELELVAGGGDGDAHAEALVHWR